ncbi:DUF7473 family protein [Haloarchaeobius amylolyticus]|uniref:DUF7473 family protein n=1 Tax=Haloarchaeobius amylolyticus TaxID=1198296 RepID=UPI00226E63C4|nr:hypothetical protein [Haloarchaeobius amylolyticus]
MLALAQLDPATGSPVAFLGTFLLAALFYAVTLHIAARNVLGSVPVKPAFVVGPLLAAVSLLLQRRGPAVVIPVLLLLDAFAIHWVYGLDRRETAFVAVIHYTVAVILGFTLYNLVALLSTAPT